MSGLEQVFRQYAPPECGPDGYPVLWHKGIVLGEEGPWVLDADLANRRDQFSIGIKHLVRQAAEHRCVRCLHPYECGEHGSGEWSPCDAQCRHDGPVRYLTSDPHQRPHGTPQGELRWHVEPSKLMGWQTGDLWRDSPETARLARPEAQWRILTVHHLNQRKADCRWWNLVALCQRCHLQIQGKVQMARVWPWEHSDWFKPYVAGYYAATYLDEELERPEVEARMDELLDLERVA